MTITALFLIDHDREKAAYLADGAARLAELDKQILLRGGWNADDAGEHKAKPQTKPEEIICDCGRRMHSAGSSYGARRFRCVACGAYKRIESPDRFCECGRRKHRDAPVCSQCKREHELEVRAAEMFARGTSRGRGCKSILRAIERRRKTA